MAVYCKRPLAAGCLLMILGSALAYLCVPAALILLFAALGGVLLILILNLKYKLSYLRLYFLVLALGLIVGCGRTLFDIYTINEPLEERCNTVASVQCTVQEVLYGNSYSSAVIVKIEQIDSTSCGGAALLLQDAPCYFRAGDALSFTAQVLALEQTDVSYPNAYRAEGCAVALIPDGEEPLSLMKGGAGNDFRHAMSKVQSFFEGSIRTHVGGEEGNLLNALLLGDRSALSELTVRWFRRAGVSHLLALSGLHLGILVGFFDRFLSMLGLGKKPRMVTVLCVMLFYLALTGFSYSMLRSVMMLSAVYIAFGLGESNDPLTALMMSGALILLVTPYAVLSTAYQMTMLATFGILAFQGVHRAINERLPKGKGALRPLLLLVRVLLSSLFVTASATVAVLPVQWLTFGEFSVATPLSNLLLIPPTAILLVLGLLVLFAYPAPLFGYLAKLTASFLLAWTERIADSDCVVSLTYGFVPFILLPFFAVVLVLLLVDLKKRKALAVLPVPLVIVVFAVCLILHRQGISDTLIGTYRVSGSNEGIVLHNDKGSVMIDVSAGSALQLQRNWELLRREGETELDVLMLTHYHNAHATALSRFGKRVLIRSLWVPTPTTEDDERFLLSLRTAAEKLNISVTVYPRETALRIFETGTLMLTDPLYEKRSTQPAFCLRITYGEDVFQYESAAYGEFARRAGLKLPPVSTTLYVPGTHGPVPHEPLHALAADGFVTTVLVANEKLAELLPQSFEERYIYGTHAYRFLFD